MERHSLREEYFSSGISLARRKEIVKRLYIIGRELDKLNAEMRRDTLAGVTTKPQQAKKLAERATGLLRQRRRR